MFKLAYDSTDASITKILFYRQKSSAKSCSFTITYHVTHHPNYSYLVNILRTRLLYFEKHKWTA